MSAPTFNSANKAPLESPTSAWWAGAANWGGGGGGGPFGGGGGAPWAFS